MTKMSILKDEHDDEYRPTRQGKLGLKKKKAHSHLNKVINSSKWTPQQNESFLNFIQINRQLLLCPLKRKEQRIFLQLSKAVVSRTPDQCRSHHQKMIKHHQNLDGIVEHLKQRLFGTEPKCKEWEEIQIVEEKSEKIQKSEDLLISETFLDMVIDYENSPKDDIWDVFNEQIWSQKQNWNQNENFVFQNN